MKNTLYYGDNLDVMRQHIVDESIDLVYLDPPFNSNAGYNVLFLSAKGHKSDAQIEAFEDTWHWGPQAEREFAEILHSPNTSVAELMSAMRSFLGENDMMAYLTMMGNRLIEMRRVLKPTGSIYLHCDPNASHYLKMLLDGIFGRDCFQNEICWARTVPKSDYKQGAINWPRVHDIIFYYTKSVGHVATFSQPFSEYTEEYVQASYPFVEEGTGRRYGAHSLTAPGAGSRGHPRYEFLGVTRYWRYSKEKMTHLLAEGRVLQSGPGNVPRYKRYLDEMHGVPIGDIWTDISMLQGASRERLGYQTQKPIALLERIIEASSEVDDLVLDPFCGCGTAVHAAQKLGRRWIGIDITSLAIGLIEKRLKDAFPGIEFNVEGTPADLDGARDLALRDKYQFQWWACSLVNAQPYQGKKKGADGGIDGLIFFEDQKGVAKKIIVSVKGGENVGITMVKDLIATVQGEKAEIGLFVTLALATKPMIAEAARAGFYDSPLGKSYPRLQILTIEGLLSGTERPQYPLAESGGVTFKRAKIEVRNTKQRALFGETLPLSALISKAPALERADGRTESEGGQHAGNTTCDAEE